MFTDDEKQRIYRYLSYQVKDPQGNNGIDFLNYVLDHNPDFVDMKVTDNFLTQQDALEKQQTIDALTVQITTLDPTLQVVKK